jgi:hypothetical protein
VPCRQISNYPHFVHEISRILRPGGVLILIEFDLRPIADGMLVSTRTKTDMYGWCALTEEIQRCLAANGVDVSVPEKMGVLAHETGWFSEVFQQHADVPIGFWPKGAFLVLFALCSSRARASVRHECLLVVQTRRC